MPDQIIARISVRVGGFYATQDFGLDEALLDSQETREVLYESAERLIDKAADLQIGKELVEPGGE